MIGSPPWLRRTAYLLVVALVACQSIAPQQPLLPSGNAVRSVDPQTCKQRVNDTVGKLEECIERASLWRRLSHFQQIADEHPGTQGHPNRDTGTAGYAASVAYVAALMRRAGYNVTIQRYDYEKSDVAGTPEFSAASRRYAYERDWFVARRSAGGNVTASIDVPTGSSDGCAPSDFAGFIRGTVALMERGACDFGTQVANARAAGAGAVVLYNEPAAGGAYEARLIDPAGIPVVGVAAYSVGAELLRQYRSGKTCTVHINVRTQSRSAIDYNVIADSPFGDPRSVVVVDAHLDAIYGAGMLDNASGSTTILEIALTMAKTPTHNRLRYMWFGGEELGLLGSRYYTTHLKPAELHRIAFDVDADVTATPNFDILVADPAYATKVKRFPPNVVPESRIGNELFADFFKTGGVISRPAHFGNNGTDSFAFSLVGVPNSGILTQQDCCKHAWETALWGGFRGNYEGDVPSFNGGCVDYPHRWCDNLSNNDPFVLELASKAVAYVTFKLANHRFRR
jgi:Zn-dependent M28 family amino/carboxypeptidase